VSNSPDAGMRWWERWSCLVRGIERVQTTAQEQQLLAHLAQPQGPFVLAFANAHAMNCLASSAPFFYALRSADMVLRDGAGMAALFKLLRLQPGLNLNGTDLIPQLLRLFDGRGIAFFGTQEPYLQRALQFSAREFAPRSDFVSAHGFHDTGVYTGLAQQHRPALIVLGMGMPKQEQVAASLRAALPFPCLIVCGGAIIDFLGGKTPRAPLWMRRTGLEWAFRLVMEPRRLFQRYVIGNPLFLLRALRLASLQRE
jgi:N-acetylglucosaminyldiphosphoundecaprenol N-acetyl-beta-D-mannosaminyltransferase